MQILMINSGFKKLNLCTKSLNPFKPEITIVIFIHYKSRIAVAIVVDENELKLVTNEKYTVIFKTVPLKCLF